PSAYPSRLTKTRRHGRADATAGASCESKPNPHGGGVYRVLCGIDRVRADDFSRGCYFRLLNRSRKNPGTRCRLDAHLLPVGDGAAYGRAQGAVEDDGEAIPPFPDVAVEPDTIRSSGNEPPMASPFQANGL